MHHAPSFPSANMTISRPSLCQQLWHELEATFYARNRDCLKIRLTIPLLNPHFCKVFNFLFHKQQQNRGLNSDRCLHRAHFTHRCIGTSSHPPSATHAFIPIFALAHIHAPMYHLASLGDMALYPKTKRATSQMCRCA